jgi:thioesterase domain-containing protein
LVAGGGEWPGDIPPLSVMQIYNWLESRYRPRALPDTPVLLVRATRGEGSDTPYRDMYQDAHFGWGAVAGRLEVVDVPGGHSSMLQEQAVDSLAAAILADRPTSAAGSARA